MDPFFWCLAMIWVSFFLPLLYMMYRNTMVYWYRVQWLSSKCGLPYEERNRRYESLPSYDKMMWQVFTFNWDYCWQDGVPE